MADLESQFKISVSIRDLLAAEHERSRSNLVDEQKHADALNQRLQQLHETVSENVMKLLQTSSVLEESLRTASSKTDPASSESMLAAMELSAYESQDTAFDRELSRFIEKQFRHRWHQVSGTEDVGTNSQFLKFSKELSRLQSVYVNALFFC